MTLNGSLAGLVAVTAGCDAVSIGGAAIIGIAAGLLLPISVNFFDSVLKIDDPVGAISVRPVQRDCGACSATASVRTTGAGRRCVLRRRMTVVFQIKHGRPARQRGRRDHGP